MPGTPNSPLFKVEVLKDGEKIATIFRVLKEKQCGNFNPVFCSYKKKQYLVNSTEGCLADPFRRTEAMLSKLYIKI